MKTIVTLILVLGLTGCAAESRHAPGPAPTGPVPDAVPARPSLPGRVQVSLFAPDRVLARAEVLGLSAEQRQSVADDVRRTQAAWDVLAERLRVEESALVAVLDRPAIDPEAAARAAAAVIRTEGELKTTHLALLVRVKNALTPTQQQALAAQP